MLHIKQSLISTANVSVQGTMVFSDDEDSVLDDHVDSCNFCKSPMIDECSLCSANVCTMHATACSKCVKNNCVTRTKSFCHKHRVHSSHIACIEDAVIAPVETVVKKEDDL